MIMRILTLSIVLGGAWWFYNGPWQEQHNPNYEERLEKLQKDMRGCIRGKQYHIGATGENIGIPEDLCAQEHNAYMSEAGRWHPHGVVER